MSAESPKTIDQFCRDNHFSRQTFYNLTAIGRAPTVMRIGKRVLISPEAEAAWRRDIAERPILGRVRPEMKRLAAQSVAA
jgi:hypothetical protein